MQTPSALRTEITRDRSPMSKTWREGQRSPAERTAYSTTAPCAWLRRLPHKCHVLPPSEDTTSATVGGTRADMFIVHGRTRSEDYATSVDYEGIRTGLEAARATGRARKHLLWYASGFPDIKRIRGKLSAVLSLDEARNIIGRYASDLPSDLRRFALCPEGSKT